MARKAEIEAALIELDRIEAIAAGQSATAPANGKSHNQAVIEAVADGPKSIEELSGLLGLTSKQVYHALTSHRLRRLVKSVRVDGERVYALKGYDPQNPEANATLASTSLTDAIIEHLAENSDTPLATTEITEALAGKVASTAKNFRGTVASTLSTLVKAGKIKRVPGEGYTLRRKSDFFN